MRLTPRSTDSTILTALALALAVVFSAWSVVLAISAHRARAELDVEIRRMYTLAELRQSIDALGLVAFDATGPYAADRWLSSYGAALAKLETLEERANPAFHLRIQLASIRTALEGMQAAAQPLLAGSAGPDDVKRFRDALQRAHHQQEVAVGRVKFDQEEFTSAVSGKWQSLFATALLAVGTALLLLALLGRARRDAQRHRRAEEALRRSEERFRVLLHAVPDLIMVLGPDGSYRQVYTAEPDLLARPAAELLGRTIHEVLPADAAAAVQRVVDEALATGAVQQIEYPLLAGGQDRWFSARAVRLGDDDPQVLWIARDMTERRRFEQMLKDTEDRLRMLNARLEKRVAERTQELGRVNLALESRNRDLRAEVAQRQRAQEVQHALNRVLERLAAGDPLPDVLALLVATAEEVQPPMIGSVLLLDPDTRRLRHGASVSLPEFYNHAVDGLEIGPAAGSCGAAAHSGQRVVVEDIQTHPNWVSFREVAGRAGLRACWSEPIRSSTGEVLGTFAIYYREARGPTAQDFEFITAMARIAGIAVERSRAEQELRSSQERLRVADRLAALGTLTAGLGHDMNNILFPTRCRFDALDWSRVAPRDRALLEAARDTVDHLQQLSDGLRLVAVDPEDAAASSEATVLAEWWGRVQPLMRQMLKDGLVLEADIAEDLPTVDVAPHRLTQAVLNLIVNAGEASPGGGTIRVWARPGDTAERVLIGVTDRGIGMTPEVRRRAFDPFFTTKTRRLSTGLGLSLVSSLVRMSRGTVELDSEPGRGTTVTLSLPAVVAGAAAAPGAEANGSPPRGRAVVSLDDDHRAAWVINVLTGAGYEANRNGRREHRESRLLVTEPGPGNFDDAKRFAGGDRDRRIIVLGGEDDAAWRGLGAIVVEDAESLEAIRSAVHAVCSEVTSGAGAKVDPP